MFEESSCYTMGMATDSSESHSSSDAGSPSRRIPESAAASPDEVKAAIETLTKGQLVKLEKYARYRIRGLGRKALGRDHGDLIKEALAATLAGDRRWRKATVDFFTHLTGVMRSISSHWGEQFSPEEAYAESDLMREDGRPGPLQSIAAETPSIDNVIDARQRLAQIERQFASDPAVPSIINGFRKGMTGPEIQLATGLSKKDYESAIKRMRRGLAGMDFH